MSEIAYLDICCFGITFAEASAARWFVTTDDRLVKVATRNRNQLRVDVVMPDQVPLETGGAPS